MINEIKIYCDVDRHGNLVGQHRLNIEAKIADQFAGQMVVIIIRGMPRDVKSMRLWYFAGIIPDYIGILKAHGNAVDPKDSEQRKEVHRYFKSIFIPPLTDEFGNFINEKGHPVDEPIHTTKNLGYSGWLDFINKILQQIEDKFGVVMKPKQVKK